LEQIIRRTQRWDYQKNEGEYLMSPSYGISIADSLSYGDKYIVVHNDAYEYLTRKSHKKIKRRLYYDVSFYYGGERQSHYFESAKKMRKFVNNIHELVSCDVPGVRIEKTWCYREHSPRHKWYYVSYYPNQFVCVERY
jgi:protein gp37